MRDKKEQTTYGLSPEQMARLLAIGLEEEWDQDDLRESQTAAEVLQDMLSGKPPGDDVPGADRTLGDLLLDSKTDLAVIKTLKEYGKELFRRPGPEANKAAPTVIYYVAIANALAFHHQKITQHSYVKLQETFGDLEEKKWVPPELKNLFREAKAVCQQRKGKTR